MMIVGALLFPSLVFAAPTFVRFLGATDVRRQTWAVWSVIALVLALVTRFPGTRPEFAPALFAHLPLALLALVGLSGGMALRSRIDTRTYRRWLRYALLIIAILLIVQYGLGRMA